MSKRDIESVLDQINVALNDGGTALTPNIQEVTQVLKRLNEVFLDKAVPKTIAAKEFNMEKATLAFGLQYGNWGREYLWKIEDILSVRDLPTSSLGTVPRNFESCSCH